MHRLASSSPAVAYQPAGGSVDPTSESSDSTSTATGQGARSTQSAPGAMVGRERRHKPEDVHRHSLPPRPSTMRCAGAAQPNAPNRERRPVPADGHRGERPSAMRCAGAAQPSAPSSADGHASKPTKRCSWSAETLARVAVGTSSALSAPSSMQGRSARRKMRRIRREWLADERARHEFAIAPTFTFNPSAVRCPRSI